MKKVTLKGIKFCQAIITVKSILKILSIYKSNVNFSP